MGSEGERMMVLFLLACFISDAEVDDGYDPDGDGYGPEEDCGPYDATVNPSAQEVWYDGVDQDCGGGSDYDQDGDGFASGAEPDTLGLYGLDCNDLNPKANPTANELCDEFDNDCDDAIDEGSASPPTWYEDHDGDFSGGEEWGKACTQPFGTVANNDDCNDSDASVYTGAPELCKDGVVNDCNESEDFARQICGFKERIWLEFINIKWSGSNDFDRSGWSTAGVGDVNGDGRGDILVGSIGYEKGGSSVGAAHLLLSSGALVGANASETLSTADLTFVGEVGESNAGSKVSGAGDVNGDGLADLMVAASGGASGSTTSGAVYLILSAATTTQSHNEQNLTTASVKFLGEADGDQAGASISTLTVMRDINEVYLIIGAPNNRPGDSWGDGAVYFVSTSDALNTGDSVVGLQDATVKLISTDVSSLGYEVSGGGDVDGDGHTDALIGSGGEGAFLFLGDSLAYPKDVIINENDADCRLTDGTTSLKPGISVSMLGDIDGDGLADIAVGDWLNTSGIGTKSGMTFLLLSSGALLGRPSTISLDMADIRLLGESRYDESGRAISAAGDVDGDGLIDLLVGAPGKEGWGWGGLYTSITGAVYVLLSSGSLSVAGTTLSLSEADVVVMGTSHIGTAISSAGDVNGDQFDDLLVGAPLESSGGLGTGAAYLLFGRSF